MLTKLLMILLAVPATAILLAHLVIYLGIIIARIRERRLAPTAQEPPSVCVVVPARDEERLLPRLLASLLNQSMQNFDVVLVNDRSVDSTGSIMDTFASEHPAHVQVVHLKKPSNIGNSKLHALICGVERARTDCILFTDADCEVPPYWVEQMSRSFADANTGLVLGPIETMHTGTLLSLFHSFDHAFKYAYNAGCTGINQATGGFGNNLGVRATALDEIGGMKSIAISVTEDAALVAALRERTAWHIRARFDRAVTVLTEPQSSLRDLTAQELRWHSGGLFSPDLTSRVSYRFVMFYLTASIVALPVIPLFPIVALLPTVSLLTMSGIAVLSGLVSRQPVRGYWIPLIPFVLTEMFYDSFLTVRAMFHPKLIWKGEAVRPTNSSVNPSNDEANHRP